ETPESVRRRLRLAGGINRYGEPNYRVVWGWSRLTWIGGKWEDRDEHGRLRRETVQLRQVPKYIPHNRWHIERWCPPELYGSPADWYARHSRWKGIVRFPRWGRILSGASTSCASPCKEKTANLCNSRRRWRSTRRGWWSCVAGLRANSARPRSRLASSVRSSSTRPGPMTCSTTRCPLCMDCPL